MTRELTPNLPFAERPVAAAEALRAGDRRHALRRGGVLAFGFDLDAAADALVALVVVAATLESVFGFWLGCKLFAVLMRIGIVPDEICESCNDIWSVRTSDAVAAR